MIKTGDESDAGTDANVYLQMFGEKGKTQNFALREEGDKRRFETGRMDKFLIRTQDIGKVRIIKRFQMALRQPCRCFQKFLSFVK